MALSTVSRLVLGLVTFIILARVLGPESYGFFAISFTYATFASIFTDFGYTNQLARKIGMNPEMASEALRHALRGKSWLIAVVLSIGLVALLFGDARGSDAVIIGIVVAGVLVNAYADLILTGVRSVGFYKQEAAEILVSSLVLLLILFTCYYLRSSLLETAIAFCIAKVIHLALVLWIALHAGIRFAGNDWLNFSDVLNNIRRGKLYAVDNFLTILSSQIDVAQVGFLFDLEATGHYQIASRLVIGETALAAALAGVHIPKAASMLHGDRAGYIAYERKMMLEFIVLGIFLSLSLLIFGPSVVGYALGELYAQVNQLWPGFAMFVFLRFLAAALGIALLVRGQMYARVLNQLVSLFVTVVAILVAAQSGDLALVPWALSIGASTLVVLYGAAFLRASPGKS